MRRNSSLQIAICVVVIIAGMTSVAASDGTSYDGVQFSVWLGRLASGGEQEKRVTTPAVQTIGTNGIPLLRRYRDSEDSWIRRKASEVLSPIGGDDYLPASASERKRLAKLGYDAFDSSVALALIGRFDNPSLLYGDDEPVYEAMRDLDRIGAEAVPGFE